MMDWIVKNGAVFQVAFTSAVMFWLNGAREVEQVVNISGLLASVAVLLFGVILIATSILLALPENRLIGNLRKTGHLKYLLNELFDVCEFHFIAIALFVFSVIDAGDLSRIVLTVAIFFAVVGFINMILSVRKMAIVIASAF